MQFSPARDLEIDGFRLEERLHQGGLGSIWRVSKPGIDFPIAMKLPLLRPGDNPLNIVGYEMEQIIMPRLSGPHVPRFVAAGNFDGPYIVMEMIPGVSLKERLPELPLPPAEVADLGARIADALEALHRQRTIHLDLKPSNIMVRASGEVVLLDFGLSRHLDFPDLLGEEFDEPVGTGAYVAPEQILGIRTDPRSDLFSLGVLLYFFACGERPYGEPQTLGLWRKRLHTPPKPPRAWHKDVPPWLQEIILTCLEIDPNGRYQTAAHLAFDLRHPELVKLTERAEQTSRPGRMSGWLKRLRPAGSPEWANSAPRVGNGPPIVMAAVDLSDETLAGPLREAVERFLAGQPGARLACINIMKLARFKIDEYEDEQGQNLHLLRLSQLKLWSEPLERLPNPITYHVLEALDPAAVIVDFARRNNVEQIFLGARANSTMRRYLGSVSTQVVAEANCSVTVVRAPRGGDSAEPQSAA
jgi:serine/threonine protein kinase